MRPQSTWNSYRHFISSLHLILSECPIAWEDNPCRLDKYLNTSAQVLQPLSSIVHESSWHYRVEGILQLEIRISHLCSAFHDILQHHGPGPATQSPHVLELPLSKAF